MSPDSMAEMMAGGGRGLSLDQLLGERLDPESVGIRPMTFRPITIPVELVYVQLRVSIRRQVRRGHERSDRTAARWLKRTLDRGPWRYVIAGDPVVSYAQIGADFLLNEQRVRASARVLFPPPGLLEGVDRLDVTADAISVQWPSRDGRKR